MKEIECAAAGAHVAAMIPIEISWQGELRTEATHGPSGTTLVTDAPVDNHGRGESFSPTDLVAAALGSCMLTIMGIYAQNHAIDLTGTRLRVVKHMTPPPRRIGKLEVEIRLPLPEDFGRRTALEQAALTCPVHQSLHPDVEIPVNFVWEG